MGGGGGGASSCLRMVMDLQVRNGLQKDRGSDRNEPRSDFKMVVSLYAN